MISFPTESECRRCGGALDHPAEAGGGTVPASSANRILSGVVKICVVVCGLLLLAYLSLTLTSDTLTYEQKQSVSLAVRVLDENGFGDDASLYRSLINFRRTDNWWNRWNGHVQAYASANFPFEVVTLYSDFFNRTADDVERAAILLHEAYHLRGHGEATAHREVWQLKGRLGWTEKKYGKTRVWSNVRESTAKFAPELFHCGPDGRSDCVP